MSRAALGALCALAALRVAVFACAFPFFHNVDEAAHLDAVLHWARLGAPRGLAPVLPETAELVGRFETHAFALPEGAPRPSPEEVTAAWTGRVSHELNQPPAYYALAAAWWRLGEAAGLSDLALLRWLRLLQAPLAALFVWLCARAARAGFPESPGLPFAAAALAAVWPQDAFYGLSNDPLAAVAGAAALCAALEAGREGASARQGLAAGLLCSLALLTKLSAAGVAAAATLLLARAPARAQAAAAAGLLPFGAWLLRNQLVLGEPTGEREVLAYIGWAPKPWRERLAHPLWSPRGALFFLSETCKTFWRGEFVWHGRRLASAPADLFYGLSTAAFLAASLGRERRRAALWLCLAAPAAMLVWGSVAYDHGDRWYPSRAFPFFVSGRIAAGSAAAFFLLYAAGLRRAGQRLGRRGAGALLALAALAALGSEAALYPR